MIDDTQVQEPEIQEQEITEEKPLQESQPEQRPAPQPQQQETEGERNFRVLRQDKARLERERDDMQRRLKELEARPDEEIMVGDDDIVEGKHLSKTVKKLKKLEEEVRAYKEQASMLSVETRIKNQFNDFDKVVTMGNIEKLKSQYPEIATTLDATPDMYSKAVAAYTLIQKLGLSESDVYMADKQKAQENAAKPRPLASVSPQQGGSPLERANAFANGLTPELKSQLLKEMEDVRRNY